MPGNYTHTTRATGLTLTAAIYNADHNNHITYNTPAGLDDYSSTVSEMQVQTDPGEVGSESQATSTAGELERLRYALAEMKGTSYWYESSFGTLSDPSANHILYNTSFEFWQNGTSLTDAASAVIQSDGWNWSRSGAGRVTMAKETSVLPTVSNLGSYLPSCLSITVTTNDNAIGATDYYYLFQSIEGYYFQPIAQRTFTLSFWVRSAVTGTYCVTFVNTGGDRSYVAEYTISSANTWEYKTITVTASPSAGTWDYTNGVGLYVIWTLAAGSNHQTTADAWASGNYRATASQVNFMATGSNTFYLAAPKITPGPTASRWISLPYELELSRAQRYYEKSYPVGTAPGTAFTAGSDFGVYPAGPATNVNTNVSFKVTKRGTPTVTQYDAAGTSGAISYFDGAWNNGGSFASTAANTTGFWGRVIAAGTTVLHYHWVADSRI